MIRRAFLTLLGLTGVMAAQKPAKPEPGTIVFHSDDILRDPRQEHRDLVYGYWDPQPDITLQELAQVMPFLVNDNLSSLLGPYLDKQQASLRRHFKEIHIGEPLKLK